MKKNLIFSLFLTTLILVMAACNKEEERTCNLTAGPDQPFQTMTVVYSAVQTGDGVISSLTYYTSATDMVTVTNPQLPWSVTVTVDPGTNVMISATGTVKNGSLNVSYEGTAAGEYISGNDLCSQEQE
jgi:hypothetical protein